MTDLKIPAGFRVSIGPDPASSTQLLLEIYGPDPGTPDMILNVDQYLSCVGVMTAEDPVSFVQGYIDDILEKSYKHKEETTS